MTLAEIQSFKKVGRHLRTTREMRGLSLTKIAGVCGLGIQELSHIESGELMGFKQTPESRILNATLYAKVLNLELSSLQLSQNIATRKIVENDEILIPAFLKKK